MQSCVIRARHGRRISIWFNLLLARWVGGRSLGRPKVRILSGCQLYLGEKELLGSGVCIDSCQAFRAFHAAKRDPGRDP